MIAARLDPANQALLAPNEWYLRTCDGSAIDDRVFAQVKWSNDGNVVFVFHNLWNNDVTQAYAIPDELAGRIAMRDDLRYRFYDVLSQRPMGECRPGHEIRGGGLYVAMDQWTRAQWLRLERCS